MQQHAAPVCGLTVRASVAIFSGYSSRQIGTGTVVRVLQRWVVVQSSSWAVPVRFRTCAPLRGHRITGGLAEYLNEWIRVPPSDVEASSCRTDPGCPDSGLCLNRH